MPATISVQQKKYDYIIIGAGCAGLSLLLRMIKSGHCTDKKILLIDKGPKINNDRTWCFWETQPGFFEDIVYKSWPIISFFGEKYSATMPISPYQYKMIRGIDFYTFSFNEIAKWPNIKIVYGEVSIKPADNNGPHILLDGKKLLTGKAIVFNSIYIPKQPEKKSINLLQHFKGWVIETETSFFDPDRATFMDFRVHQNHGTSFAYVLPTSSTSALVEYTLFTKELLQPEQYESELKTYIADILKLEKYTVKEKEFGVIPMTNERFSFSRNGMFYIGTAGGQTKASSGFTFQFIQQQSDEIIKTLIAPKSLRNINTIPKRFRFYDDVLLYLLYHDKVKGRDIFTTLFKKNKPQKVLRFLDNQTSLSEELKIISGLPTWPFLKAAVRQVVS